MRKISFWILLQNQNNLQDALGLWCASCISISGYKLELVFHGGRWAVDPRVPRLCSLHPQRVWRPHRVQPWATMSDLGAGPLLLQGQSRLPFPPGLPCGCEAWVMSRRRHKRNFCWFWMELWTRYCSENPDIFSGIRILLIQNNSSQIFLLI